jgi:ATP-dependent Clp protease protease subunit
MSAVYDTMQVITCDVATTCLGQAASVAAVLLAAGAPGKRTALPGARVVMQQPSYEEPLRGQPSDLEIHAAELLRLREQLAGMLVRHTGQTPGRIADDLERDKMFDASAAREYGLIDHVIASRKISAAPSPAGR